MRKIKCKDGSCTLSPMDNLMQTGGGGLDVRSVDYLVPLRTIQNKTKTKVKRKTTKQVGGRKRKASTKTKVSKAKPRKTSVRKKSKSTKTKK